MAKVVLPRSLPRLLVHLFVRVFRGNDFFVHGQEKKEGWGEIYGSTCAPDSSQILAFQLSGGGGAVERKVLNPPGNIDIPTWAFYCLRPTVVSARCSPITLNCLPFRPPEGLFLTGKLLFIVSKAEKLVLERSHKVLTFTYSASCSFSVKFK